ncbi:MAG: DUF2384 domain-containing protein [Pseudomonadota bacterium]
MPSDFALGHIFSPRPPIPSSAQTERNEAATDIGFCNALQDPVLAPMLSPLRYISLLGMDVETLARDARVSVRELTHTPSSVVIQSHLRNNLRVIKAAYDASGGDLAKSLRWFRAEPLQAFSQKTAEQAVSNGQADEVVRLIDSLYAGAAG